MHPLLSGTNLVLIDHIPHVPVRDMVSEHGTDGLMVGLTDVRGLF